MGASPQRGYNHNIAHRGRVYHVQSEDSGTAKSHIYTHVFVDGTIIATNKVNYDPQGADLATQVVALMQASHKKMIKQLRGGELDQKIEVLLGGHPEAVKGEAAAPSKAQSPGPVLAQRKVSKTPPVRRDPSNPVATRAAMVPPAALRQPALRSPLSASEHAQEWLTEYRKEHPESKGLDDSSPEAKQQLEKLRQIIAQQVIDPSVPLVDDELAQLFADL